VAYKIVSRQEQNDVRNLKSFIPQIHEMHLYQLHQLRPTGEFGEFSATLKRGVRMIWGG
jgi:hypothetical protein